MNVGKKLTLCITGIVALVLGLAAAGWYSTGSLATELNFVTTSVGTRAILGGELSADLM